MVPDINMQSVAKLANATARNLAVASLRDSQLREALHTEKLSDGVRIGGFDIVQIKEGNDTLFTIRSTKGKSVVSDLLFYDSARNMVAMLNSGSSPLCQQIVRLVRFNGELRRALNDIFYLEARLEQYEARGDDFRAAVQEDRLGVIRARCRYLRQELLSRRPVYL